jgi:lipoyl synthase
MPGESVPHYHHKPRWLHRVIPSGASFREVVRILDTPGVHTVCSESLCPNMGECFSRGTATFLILGANCTRRCAFCNIESGHPLPLDPDEPRKIADAVHRLGLRYAVVTSVTRDDLPDGGAAHYAAVIEAIRTRVPDAGVEVLVPDFGGSEESLRIVLDAHPDVIANNLDTVRRLHASVKPRSDYLSSLELLRRSSELAPTVAVKSGLMLGMGETRAEVESALRDLFSAGCRMVTIGQYLPPSSTHSPAERFVHPPEFDEWNTIALGMGFTSAVCGPLVRSSYRAGEHADMDRPGRRKDQ